MIELRGTWLALHPEGEGVSDGIRRSGDFYEAEILDYLGAVHQYHEVIVDAGANIGNHTLYFATGLTHQRIHAFEPIPENYALLRQNVGAFPSVQTYQQALSDKAGTLRMKANAGNMGACLVAWDGDIEVKAVTLDELNLANVTLLKLDVENHEAAVLSGATRTIAKSHPLVLIEDWSFGESIALLPGYELERAWPEAFTYLYRWAV